jgi:uncharacterized membrane protein YbhN (UPF0104 family)
MAGEGRSKKQRITRLIGFGVSLLLVIGIFVYAVPKFADYSSVWAAVRTLTPIEVWSLIAVTILNLFTYWLANMAALPGLRLGQAAVLTQTTTSVANTLPGGGAIAVGLTYTILRSWGFSGTDTALYVGVTGIWNIFTKLALPLLSIVALVVTGKSSSAYVAAAVAGIVVLGVSVGLLAAVFMSDRLARAVGDRFGRILGTIQRLVRRNPTTGLGDRFVRFRNDTIGLVRHRWVQLSVTTVLSHIALFLVLLLALRHMGVSERDVGTAEVFAVFAFSRLLGALPLTPGGVGVIDLGYIGGLVAVAGDADKAPIVAAVLLFRVLTYGVQIPIGAFTYLIWQRMRSWRQEPRDTAGGPEASVAGSSAAPTA